MTAPGNSAKRRIHQYLLLEHPTAYIDADKVSSQFFVSPRTAENAVHDLIRDGFVERARIVRLKKGGKQ